MNAAPAELLHLLVDAALQLIQPAVMRPCRPQHGCGDARIGIACQGTPRRLPWQGPLQAGVYRSGWLKKTPAAMPASESSCRKAKSFFEEYAASPDIVGPICAVKKVGLGRVLSIKYSFCLSTFSFSAEAAGHAVSL